MYKSDYVQDKDSGEGRGDSQTHFYKRYNRSLLFSGTKLLERASLAAVDDELVWSGG